MDFILYTENISKNISKGLNSMKRKILCIITTLAMLLSLFAGYSKVGYAKKSIDTGLVTFEDYEGNWTGTSGAKVPANTLAGSFSAYNGTSALHGITSAAPSGDSSNGVSVKMIHKPDSSAGTYSGLLHTFDSSNRVYNTIRVQFSTYIEKSANDKYSSRVLRFYGPQRTSTSSTAVSTVSFGNGTGGGKITAGGQTLTDWVPDTWYDVDVIYNFITKEYKVTVSDGKKDYSAAGVMTSAGDMLYPNRLEFFSPYTSKKLASDGIGEQVTYWDNIRAFEDWRYTLPSGDGTNLGDCFDFEDLEVTGDVSKTTQTGDKGSQWSVTLNDTNQYGVTPYVVKESEKVN